MSNLFKPRQHPYKNVILHQDNSNNKYTRFFIENDYGKTGNFLTEDEVIEYINVRLAEGTTITINPIK